MQCPACEADAISPFAVATSGALFPARCRRCAAEVVLDSSFALLFAIDLALQVVFLGSLLLALLWQSVVPILAAVLVWLTVEVIRVRLGNVRVVSPEERRRAPGRALLIVALIAGAIALAGLFDH